MHFRGEFGEGHLFIARLFIARLLLARLLLARSNSSLVLLKSHQEERTLGVRKLAALETSMLD